MTAVELCRRVVEAIIDHGWWNFDDPTVQEILVEKGVIAPYTATRACGESCTCAEVGLPLECYRLTPGGCAALEPVDLRGELDRATALEMAKAFESEMLDRSDAAKVHIDFGATGASGVAAMKAARYARFARILRAVANGGASDTADHRQA